MFGYLDCFSGVSGDKFLGALVDAGLPLETLTDRLEGLGLGGFRVSAERTGRGALTGTLVTVEVHGEQPARHLSDIEAILEASSLSATVRDRSLAAFRLLAEAEASVHGVSLEEVHFHEVGAVDSIVDVVGTAIGLEALSVDELYASPVCTGFGTVETSHGLLPVPAPATSRLLQGVPSYAGPAEGELTTPTGAALLRTFVTRFEPMPPVTMTAEGYGAGTRQLEGVPNLLRLRLGERAATAGDAAPQPTPPATAAGLEDVVVLESAIDHVTPEDLATALEHQLEAGALDAWQAPLVMKKGRMGAGVTVLARPTDAERLTELLMADTGTLGVRRTLTQRAVADRHVETLETSLGQVRVKIAEAANVTVARPEHDDVAEVSHRTGLAIKDVAARLSAEVARARQNAEVESAIQDASAPSSSVEDDAPAQETE